VPVRKGTRRAARKRGLAGLAALGITAIAALVAAWGVSPVETSEFAPADVVALRFPADWINGEETAGTARAAAPAPVSFVLASADARQIDSSMLFSPRQTYPVAAAAPAPQPSAVAPAAAEPKAEIKPEAKPAAAPTRSIAAAPQRKPAPRAKRDSGELFNDAQLASIKSRLKLSEYQEQYWPPVETALRAIGHAAARGAPSRTTAMGYASETRLAQIDPDSAEVQQLKSAAFPLIMSMNDDQKQQVRMIAHVMGLERVASSF
jgi:hypothetical protein